MTRFEKANFLCENKKNMIKAKIFNGRKIIIRELSPKDLKRVKDFLDYINSLIEENAKIRFNKKLTLKEEKEWLKNTLKEIRKKEKLFVSPKPKEKLLE